MPKIIPISWRKFGKFLLSVGCELHHTGGDHLIYKKKGLKRPIVVPKIRDIPQFIILNNLRVLGINRDEYLEALKPKSKKK